MRPLEEVRAEVLATVRRLEFERVVIHDAVGRVLAASVTASEDVPPFANSAMDGFALRADDVEEPGSVLEIIEDVPAGRVASMEVGEGEATRIMTGAPMPPGADTVVRVEDTSVEDAKLLVSVSVPIGNHVRPAGGDVSAGRVVFEAGARLTAMHVGVLATIGVVEPLVSRRPRVGLMSTGDELMPADTASLGPGMIRDSNRPMLAALLEGAGAEVVDYGSVPDDAAYLEAALGRAAVETDVIVTSGGVSMGDYDVTKLVLSGDAGVDFMQVAMKPAKPFGFGVLGGAPFFGLPGNPVSAFVSFEQFVRPALLAMQGATAILRPRVGAVAGEPMSSDPAKVEFLRVRVSEREGSLIAVHAGGQDSNVLSAAANADAFAIIPLGVERVEAGDPVILELFHSRETRSGDDT